MGSDEIFLLAVVGFWIVIFLRNGMGWVGFGCIKVIIRVGLWGMGLCEGLVRFVGMGMGMGMCMWVFLWDGMGEERRV